MSEVKCFSGDPALDEQRKLGHFYAPECSMTQPHYHMEEDESGSPTLVVDGQTPSYKMIQAAREGVCLTSLIEQFRRSGDTEVFNVSEGFFADVTNLPSDRLGWENMLARVSTEFEGMPLQVRAKYDHNYKKFLRAIDDGSFMRDFSSGVKEPKTPENGKKTDPVAPIESADDQKAGIR